MPISVRLFLISFFGLCVSATAQQEKIDSLRSLLPGKTDAEQADILYELAYEYVDFNDTLGAKYGEKSFQLAKRIGDSLRMVKAGRIRATAFRRLAKMDSVIILGLEILPIALRNHYAKEVKQILRGVALAYTYKGNYDLGLHYNFELLKNAEHDNDSLEMSYALNNIGLVYFKLTNAEKALHYFNRALDVKHPSDPYPKTTAFLNISLCYSELKDFPRANEFLKKGISSCKPNCQGMFLVEGLRTHGVFHFHKENLDSAEIYFLKSYSLAKKLGYKRYQLILAVDLVDIYLQKGRIYSASRYLSEAESIVQEAPFGYELILLYSNFLSFYKKTSNEKKIAFYQEKYILLKDSIDNEALTNNLMKIESDYLERGNMVKIAEQGQLLELKDQVIKRQSTFNLMIGVTTVLLLALLYVLHRSNRQRKSVNHFLDQKVKERTAELESNYLASRKSFEENDRAMASTFADIRDATATIKELCSAGLTDGSDTNVRKCLLKISSVVRQVSLMLGDMREAEEMK